jgi:hypothetical protein
MTVLSSSAAVYVILEIQKELPFVIYFSTALPLKMSTSILIDVSNFRTVELLAVY